MADPLNIGELGERVRRLRLKRGYSLQDLSGRATVSVSMLSAVERGEKVASILVLHQIAMALKTSIAQLIEDEALPRVFVQRSDEQLVINDGSGWVRRLLSPALDSLRLEMTRTSIEPGVDAGEFGPHRMGSRAYLSVEAGVLTLILDGGIFELNPGDSICFAGDSRQIYRNDGIECCDYYLALDLGPEPL